MQFKHNDLWAQVKNTSKGETEFWPEVRIHQGFYVSVEKSTEDRVSFNPNSLSSNHKDQLELFTINPLSRRVIQTSRGDPQLWRLIRQPQPSRSLAPRVTNPKLTRCQQAQDEMKLTITQPWNLLQTLAQKLTSLAWKGFEEFGKGAQECFSVLGVWREWDERQEGVFIPPALKEPLQHKKRRIIRHGVGYSDS